MPVFGGASSLSGSTCSRGEPVCDLDESDAEQRAEYQSSAVDIIPGGGAVLPVTEGKQARQIHILSLQMTRVVDDSASILRVRQLLPEQPAECVLQTTNLGNASQSGTARMIPQDGQLE